jgi:hypothetical protein
LRHGADAPHPWGIHTSTPASLRRRLADETTRERPESRAPGLTAGYGTGLAQGDPGQEVPMNRSRFTLAAGLAVLVVACLGAGFGLGRWYTLRTMANEVASAVTMSGPLAGMPSPAVPPVSPDTSSAPTQAGMPHPGPVMSGQGQQVSTGPPAMATAGPELQALFKDVERETAMPKQLVTFGDRALAEGQRPAALWAYKRALARDPKHVGAITGIATLLYAGQFMDQALARADEALGIDPKYAPAHWQRARILDAKQDYAGAIREAEAFLQLTPKSPDAERARALIADAKARASAGAQRSEVPPAASEPTKSR